MDKGEHDRGNRKWPSGHGQSSKTSGLPLGVWRCSTLHISLTFDLSHIRALKRAHQSLAVQLHPNMLARGQASVKFTSSQVQRAHTWAFTGTFLQYETVSSPKHEIGVLHYQAAAK